jgi:hypothetical protein
VGRCYQEPKREAGIEMTTLYSMQRSGNSYNVRLALAQLRIPHRLVEVDVLRGESRTPEFLANNPSGRVPLLEIADIALITNILAGQRSGAPASAPTWSVLPRPGDFGPRPTLSRSLAASSRESIPPT